jgi:purine nucleosidase
MTVVDWRGVTGRKANANFMAEIDADGFYRLMTEQLQNLP